MNDLSVTLKQKRESIFLGGLFLLLTLVFGAIACFSGESGTIVAAVLCALGSGALFFRAGNQQVLDSEGIHIKTYLGEKHYPWELVEKTRIIKTSYKDLPRIQFVIRGRKTSVWVYYTRRTLDCLRYYYGEPDENRVEEPPASI